MNKLVSYMFLSCKKVTELIEKRNFSPLKPKEKVQLHIHKAMCKACVEYEKQSLFIDKILDNTKVNADNIKPKKLDESFKEKIKTELNNE